MTSDINERLFSHDCTVFKNGPINLDADILCKLIVLSSSAWVISSTAPNMKPRSWVPFVYLSTSNLSFSQVSMTSLTPFKIKYDILNIKQKLR